MLDTNSFERVYGVVSKIPKGKVVMYGQVANFANGLKLKANGKKLQEQKKVTPRIVGNALHRNPNSKKIPCHRVVDRNGRVAENFAFGGWKGQRKRLLREGVGFKDGLHVDLEKFCWKTMKV